MREVVIVAATRTAIGSFQGSLAQIPAVELGATVVRALLEKTHLDTDLVDEVIMGHVHRRQDHFDELRFVESHCRLALLLAPEQHGGPRQAVLAAELR